MSNFQFPKIFTLICSLLAFVSCEKVALDENTESPSTQPGAPANLIMTTRNGGSGNDVNEGRIYVFNDQGTCVQILSIDANNTSVTTQLPAGTYSVYAVGGNDLSSFTLPSLSDATATSVVTHQTGKLMNELLLKHTDITLAEGDERDLNITLDRKVLCIDDVVMTQMPADVTQVEVTLSTFYSSMSFDGTYPETPTESYTVALTKQEDGTTWQATPNQMLFPSKGTPVVTVSVTTTTGTLGFSYTAEAMLANKHYTISGAYSVTQGASLSCTLTASDWDEDGSVDFNLNNDNQVVYTPVAGQFCNGYYCVSVNSSAHTAVLLAKSKLSYVAPTGSTNAEDWLAAFTDPMETLDKPTGITNDWRLPTITETAIISKDTQIVTFTDAGMSAIYFCTEDDILKAGWTTKADETYTFHKSANGYNSNILLRPVIDINF